VNHVHESPCVHHDVNFHMYADFNILVDFNCLIIQTVMQFVSFGPGGFVLDVDARNMLKTMQAPLTIGAIIGRYRGGKSSLLNRLVGTDTFRTSSTVQAQTKGLMIHKLDDHTILMDTEGLGSMDVSRDHDASIFALAMLVSSGCFFNNLGGITSQAVDDLHLATKVASLLCKHAKFNKQLPELVWLMRDFGLDLVDPNGLPMSADTYFEQCIDKCEEPKASDIRSLFPSRRCVPLTRPTLEETDLREMKNLRPEFLEGIAHVRTILRQFPPKLLGDKQMNGDQLCSLVEALCTVLNSEALPNLEDVWKLVARQARKHALDQTKATFMAADTAHDGLVTAYAVYKDLVLDDIVSGEDTFTLLAGLIHGDKRGHEFEVKYVDTKREFDLHVCSSIVQMKDAEGRVRDAESHLASSHRKMARLVDEGLEMKRKIQETESEALLETTHESTELMEVLEGLQTKHKELKLELIEKRGLLDDVVKTIHAKDRTISEQSGRMLSDRKKLNDQRTKQTELESHVSDLKSNLHQSTTDIAIWRTRYEDILSRGEKKRKLNDDAYTDIVSLTAEINFLRSRHEEDAKRLQKYTKENAVCLQQIQSLQIKLALEIGK
jgi:hypothetical protein